MEYAFESFGPALRVLTLLVIFAFTLIGLAVLIALAGLPGKIAARRGHPQAEAINICGWVGLLTGFFWIVALVWAYLKPRAEEVSSLEKSDAVAELASQIARLESTVTQMEQRREEATV